MDADAHHDVDKIVLVAIFRVKRVSAIQNPSKVALMLVLRTSTV